MSGKYKITIGDRVFDAESNGNGTFQLKNNQRDFTMSSVAIDILEAKIEKVEPMRFEADVMWKACGGFAYPEGNADWHQLVGKKGKLTFVESVPDQCELCVYKYDRCGQWKCTKCGAVKP